MSTAATVPIFSPDGTLGDIPADQLTAAAKAGAKPGVHIVAPDGSPGVIPADRMRDAVQAGAKIVPIQDQPIQHPGFWVTLGSDLGGMAKGAWHAAVDPLTDTHEDLVRKLHEEQASEQAAENSPERQAHGAFYRNVTVPAASAIGVNVPGMEQSAAEGDVAGVAGHAAAPVAAATITSGVSRMAGAAGEAADAAASSPTVRAGVKAAAKQLPVSLVRRIPYVGDVAADVYKAGVKAAAQAKGAPPVEVEPLASPTAPPAAAPAAAPAPSPEAAAPAAEATEETGTGAGVPRTLSGDSALRQVLTGQDTPNLMKIAKSRGINVTQESQLKPSLAGPRLINKIIDDFSEDELGDIRDSYLENSRMGRHNFGDIGAEANKTLSMQTYFPDVKVPLAQTLRTQKAIQGAAAPKFAPIGDLAGEIKRSVVVDPQTGAPEFSDVVAAKQKASAQPGTQAAATAEEGDLTSLLQKSVDQAKANKAAASAGSETIPPGGVRTTAVPKDLLDRWGVDPKSFTEGRAQTRGMSPEDSAASIKKLTEAYKKGQPVEPLLETRDAQNNIIDVDGRGRALAAHRAGVERVPVIVRRLQTAQ